MHVKLFASCYVLWLSTLYLRFAFAHHYFLTNRACALKNWGRGSMNEIQGRHSRQWRGGDIQLTRLDMELEWIRVKEASGGKKNIIILRLTRCRNNE